MGGPLATCRGGPAVLLKQGCDVTRIHLETEIAAPVERVFDIARDIDFHQRSMVHTNERAVAGRTSGRIGAGETVTWRARHLGRTWSLTSRITVFEPPVRFVDEQSSGPVRLAPP